MEKNKRVSTITKYILRSKRYILLFLIGFLVATLFYFKVEDDYEQEIFNALVNHVKEAPNYKNFTVDSVLLQSLALTHYLGERRLSVFGDQHFSSIKSFLQPVSFDLTTAKGACGSYSYILSRLLEEMNFNTRIAQMKSNGVYGAHMVVEAQTHHGWVVLDPIYNQYFKKDDGSLASFADVQANWNWYSNQIIDKDYNRNYQYQGARYTNWNKIPVIMPAIKQVLYLTIGKEKTDKISLRNLFLRKYQFMFNVVLSLLILILVISLRKYIFRAGLLIFYYSVLLLSKKDSSSLSRS